MNEQKLATTKVEPSSMGDSQSPTASGRKDAINPYVLLFFMLLVAAVATWVAPAGEFTRTVAGGVSFVVPNSLTRVPQHGVLPGFVFVALANGMIKSAPIIFLILFTGGALAVVEATGATVARSMRWSDAAPRANSPRSSSSARYSRFSARWES